MGVLVLKGIFSETTCVCVVTYQFFSIALKSVRQGGWRTVERGGLILPPPLQNKPLKSRPRLELKIIKATSFKIFKIYVILNTPKEIFNRNISSAFFKKKVTYKAVV